MGEHVVEKVVLPECRQQPNTSSSRSGTRNLKAPATWIWKKIIRALSLDCIPQQWQCTTSSPERFSE
ncbi:hypothetical protein CC2G_013162 [Coprinopsis cinerea AmutBmut pab1-1]|nr:hypothetical protein CC2G_013162 [Coprinopsis cinerea AmutBmut pab1-1]